MDETLLAHDSYVRTNVKMPNPKLWIRTGDTFSVFQSQSDAPGLFDLGWTYYLVEFRFYR